MPYQRTIRYTSPLLAWHEIELTEPAPQWSGAYRPETARLVLPGSCWLQAEQAGERFVCDALSPLWLTPERPYRLRQPFAGQRSVVLIVGARADLPPAASRAVARRPRLGAAALWRLAQCRAALDARPDRLAFEEAALSLLPGDGPDDGQGVAPPPTHRAVERARELLAAEPAADRSLHDIARAVASSPFHLARCFRRATGLGLHAYRTRLRMALALQRLADGERQLVQLALELGYASHSHFSAAFRACFGFAPSHARERLGPRARRLARAPLRTIPTAP
ncbi:MAG: helix-turn-helix transcriptional regulator [Rubrivivax sp.]|nr:helix-turn-helix transcriptional regulator [Rubrivivax sp.]